MSRPPVILVGAARDEHVGAVGNALRERGVEPLVFDSLEFPGRSRLTFGESAGEIRIDGIAASRPAAVYMRGLYLSPLSYLVDVDGEMEESWRRTLVIFQERGEMLISLLRRWERAGIPLYNSLSASDATRKPYQLSLLAEAGVAVPETLWSNDPDEVRRFAEGRRIAYKPVRGGAATRELTEEDLAPDRLSRLANAAVCFQELLPGEDVRVFVLDGRIVAQLSIETDSLDYRQHEQRISPIELDAGTQAMCVAAARALGLRFTGMDLKRGEDGGWRVLELNPSPMFLGFDAHGGSGILGALADALVKHVSAR